MLQDMKEEIQQSSIDMTKNRNEQLKHRHYAIIDSLNNELGALRC